MSVDVPFKLKTGRFFTEEDDLLIGQPVYDNYDVNIHYIGVGDGKVTPRWFPGVDRLGNQYLKSNALIKSENKALGDNGFGFQGEDFVVKIDGRVICSFNRLGGSVKGALQQTGLNPDDLASDKDLSQLLFPLFTDKSIFVQFDRPAVAALNTQGNFKVYRDIKVFLGDFNSSFSRVGGVETGYYLYMDASHVYKTTGNNAPRLTYGIETGKSHGLLIEPLTTNTLTYSFDLTQWSNTGMNIVQENDSFWINKGLDKPFTFTETGSGEHSLTNTCQINPTLPVTASFFYKSKTFTGLRRLTCFISDTARNNLFGIVLEAQSNGTIAYSAQRLAGKGQLTDYAIAAIGNGLYRISITGVLDNTAANNIVSEKLTFASMGSVAGNNSLEFTPENNTGAWCQITDFQVEQNSFMTSFIRTANTVITRGADKLVLDLASFKFSTFEGTFEVKARFHKNNKAGTAILSLLNATGTEGAEYYIAAIDKTARTVTIGFRRFEAGIVTNDPSLLTTSLYKSNLTLTYVKLPVSVSRVVISGENGLLASYGALTYE